MSMADLSIKKFIPLRVKRRLLSILRPERKWLQYAGIREKRIFVFLAGFYQNLGDLAITYAQIRFLQGLWPEAIVIAVSGEDTFAAIPMIRKYLRKEDLITLIGGGNMSNLYTYLEDTRREVIRSFPENQIISFPQTVYFDETPSGKKELKKSQRIYKAHGNLQLFAREEESFQRMKQYFPNCKVSLAPDIVFSLDKRTQAAERKGVFVCLRRDKEQAISKDFQEGLLTAVRNAFDDVEVTDTTAVELKDCQLDTYEATLERFWEKVRSAKVVLTDRLHCLIFCVITGTPCVVLDNANHKVLWTCETWLKDQELVRVISSPDESEILAALREFQDAGVLSGRGLHWEEKFRMLANAVRRS